MVKLCPYYYRAERFQSDARFEKRNMKSIFQRIRICIITKDAMHRNFLPWCLNTAITMQGPFNNPSRSLSISLSLSLSCSLSRSSSQLGIKQARSLAEARPTAHSKINTSVALALQYNQLAQTNTHIISDRQTEMSFGRTIQRYWIAS